MSSIVYGRTFPCWIQIEGHEGTTAWNQEDIAAYVSNHSTEEEAKPTEVVKPDITKKKRKFYGNQYSHRLD